MSDVIDQDKQLAVQPIEAPLFATPMHNTQLPATQKFTFKQIETMARYVAECGLYGVKTLEQTVSIMLVAQATGQHPVLAARDYHILTFTDRKTGRVGCMPTLKADVILGRFLDAGGHIEYVDYTAEKVTMRFTWKNTSIAITWDLDRVQKAGLSSNDLYNKFPQQMMKARCVGEGVKAVCPQVMMGSYSTEEAEVFLLEDIEPPAPAFKKPITLKVTPSAAEPSATAPITPAPEVTAPPKEEAPLDPVSAPPLKQSPAAYAAKATTTNPSPRQQPTAPVDAKQKFLAQCRELFTKVRNNTIDKSTARSHYFIFCEELGDAYEDVPPEVTKVAENILYDKP